MVDNVSSGKVCAENAYFSYCVTSNESAIFAWIILKCCLVSGSNFAVGKVILSDGMQIMKIPINSYWLFYMRMRRMIVAFSGERTQQFPRGCDQIWSVHAHVHVCSKWVSGAELSSAIYILIHYSSKSHKWYRLSRVWQGNWTWLLWVSSFTADWAISLWKQSTSYSEKREEKQTNHSIRTVPGRLWKSICELELKVAQVKESMVNSRN